MTRHRRLRVLVLASVMFAASACADSKDAGKPAAAKDTLKKEDKPQYTYSYLRKGGGLYVGTIQSVKMIGREPVNMDEILERGTFQFRVRKAVRGPAVRELCLGYEFMEDDPQALHPTILADWACPFGAWKRRPRPGEQVLLLLTPPSLRQTQGKGEDVAHLWSGVGPDHPLVKDFDVAVRYLDARDESVRRDCFRRLCRSDWPTIRQFASVAVFFDRDGTGRSDWAKETQLLGEYLRLAGPKLTVPERVELTYDLRSSIHIDKTESSPGRHPSKAPAECLTAFENWYLTELGADLAQPEAKRPEEALSELRWLFHTLGIADTVALFKKHGRAGLEKRLKLCVQSADPYVSGGAQELLTLLRENRPVLRDGITTAEGDTISLQIIIPSYRKLIINRTYDSENLPPGVTLDRRTGVLSGRIATGAARNSPYKVRITQHSQGRHNGWKENARYTWVVKPNPAGNGTDFSHNCCRPNELGLAAATR